MTNCIIVNNFSNLIFQVELLVIPFFLGIITILIVAAIME